jgi:hypothetical protein
MLHVAEPRLLAGQVYNNDEALSCRVAWLSFARHPLVRNCANPNINTRFINRTLGLPTHALLFSTLTILILTDR